MELWVYAVIIVGVIAIAVIAKGAVHMTRKQLNTRVSCSSCENTMTNQEFYRNGNKCLDCGSAEVAPV